MKEKKIIIIGVSGGSGSGKTCFVRDIRQKFDIEDVCLISMDDYYHPKEQQFEDIRGVTNFDLPSSLDDEIFLQDVKKLMNWETVERTEYTYNNDDLRPKQIAYQPAGVIIIEGLFVFHYPEISKMMDYKVFIHANEDLKVIRRIRRDNTERNYPLDDVLYRYEMHVQPAYKRYIEPYRDDADIIINNQFNYDKGMEFVIAFIQSKIDS